MAQRRATMLVGFDVQSIEEVQHSIAEFGDRYTRRVFTLHEIESCGGDSATRASSLAGRFAAKEAVLKVLDFEETMPPMTSIEIRLSDNRRPTVCLNGLAAELADQQGIDEFTLSLSHSGGVAAAAVIAHIAPLPLVPTRTGSNVTVDVREARS
jgi:holo-[acyl-carrier protein] synthase